jgi:hypothetical protein
MRPLARLLVVIVALIVGLQPAFGAGCDLACEDQPRTPPPLGEPCASHPASATSGPRPSPASPCGHDHRVAAPLTEAQIATPLIRAELVALPVPLAAYAASLPVCADLAVPPDVHGTPPPNVTSRPLRI